MIYIALNSIAYYNSVHHLNLFVDRVHIVCSMPKSEQWNLTPFILQRNPCVSLIIPRWQQLYCQKVVKSSEKLLSCGRLSKVAVRHGSGCSFLPARVLLL